MTDLAAPAVFGIGDSIGHFIASAVTGLVRWLVKAAAHKVLGLLTDLVNTPDPTGNSRVHDLWWHSVLVVDTGYVLMVVTAGVLVMCSGAAGSTRHSVREYAPRLAFGFVAATCSLPLISRAIQVANAAAAAMMAGHVTAKSIVADLRHIHE